MFCRKLFIKKYVLCRIHAITLFGLVGCSLFLKFHSENKPVALESHFLDQEGAVIQAATKLSVSAKKIQGTMLCRKLVEIFVQISNRKFLTQPRVN